MESLQAFNRGAGIENLVFFSKIVKEKSPEYLFNNIPSSTTHQTTNSENIPQFSVKHNFLKTPFRLL